MRDIVVIAHNIRSAHNVGSLLRTCDGLGISKLYLTGYTPYPKADNNTNSGNPKPGKSGGRQADKRMPHEASAVHAKIAKTSLGAENSVAWEYSANVLEIISLLADSGYQVCALEQTSGAIPLDCFKAGDKIALLLGSEVNGVDPELLLIVGTHLFIPMLGSKESFNVVQAAAMALFSLRFR